MTLISTPAELTPTVLNKAVGRYYKELQDYANQANHELALRPAFQSLLAEMARKINLTLVHEMTIRGRIRPDGVLCDAFHIQRGYWEAKGPKGDLEEEIRQAVLYQASQRYDFDLRVQADATALLKRFLTYQKPDIATFEQAVVEFQGQIPNIAKRLLELINEEQQRNARFVAALTAFTDLCRTTLNPKISAEEIKEMLVQHLLTERLFRTVFDNPDFVSKNAIATEIEKVIAALTSRSFNRSAFLRSLDPFYGAIEAAARGIETWNERQQFLNTVYERFFQGFAVQKADTLGIVYTPQEIVEFMVSSVDEVLRHEFGKSQGLATLGIKILDPAVGTGNFIVNIIKHIASSSRSALREKYAHELFCNEIALLPYYVASMNIEHEYDATMGEYVPFEGICFVDTLELAESQQLPLWMSEENTERIKHEKEADIMVVIGNPPYNEGQKNQNDNNKNRLYPIIEERVRQTYVKSSYATNRNALSDVYVKFFRWATDRLQGQNGIICMVTNNSFVDQIAFDGMRKHLLQDFTQIYHLDLHGNVRKNPRISGTKHNIFGIQVGVGITIAIRNSQQPQRKLFYYRVPEDWSKVDKFSFLANKKKINDVSWLELQPDVKNNWINEGIWPEFTSYIPIGVKKFKAVLNLGLEKIAIKPIFQIYSLGVQTNRDNWVYDFNKDILRRKVINSIDMYNSEVDRWKREGKPQNIDDFVSYDDTKLKWSRDLKSDLKRGRYAKFQPEKIRRALYRPFTMQYYFLDSVLSQDIFRQPTFFPMPFTEKENVVICLSGIGSNKPFHCLCTNTIPGYDLLE